MNPYQPLAARVRPKTLAELAGQSHLLGKGKPLFESLSRGNLHSMILWGPPGVGKTTLAHLFASACNGHFISISAVLSGVKDIRESIAQAKQEAALTGSKTILFVDEVHRFNKSQQDAFLPHIEDGTVIFIGATTENPSFELNNALLSRVRVYRLKSLTNDDVLQVITHALQTDETLKNKNIQFAEGVMQQLAVAVDGDARQALNYLEVASDLGIEDDGVTLIDQSVIKELLSGSVRRFDKHGDSFYEQISALHKSIRGSNPDGALYWFCRMIDGGCDPLYVARRVVRAASEDIGNADPRALEIALNAWNVQERLGSPEGELAVAQAVIYLSCAPKSNAVYKAYNAAKALVQNTPAYEVPVHLRNAPTKLMKDIGYGKHYRYAHDEENAYAAGETYLPEEIQDSQWYQPVLRGLEIKIHEKLQFLADLDKKYHGK